MDTRSQKNRNRKRMIATNAKATAISPPTTRKPFRLLLKWSANHVHTPNGRDQCCRKKFCQKTS
jgi:hypothetical protein